MLIDVVRQRFDMCVGFGLQRSGEHVARGPP
jgi:hypothetical protein